MNNHSYHLRNSLVDSRIDFPFHRVIKEKRFPMHYHPRATLALLATLLAPAQFAGDTLKEGASFELPNATAKLTKLDTLPFADDEYTKRFKFDSFDNPKLKQL